MPKFVVMAEGMPGFRWELDEKMSEYLSTYPQEVRDFFLEELGRVCGQFAHTVLGTLYVPSTMGIPRLQELLGVFAGEQLKEIDRLKEALPSKETLH